jgi:uncharacterized repeat protein (TIGR03803 family)
MGGMKRCSKLQALVHVLLLGLCIIEVSRARAQGFRILWTADGTNGMSPVGLVVSGDIIYGTANRGGSTGNGSVFRVNTDGTAFEILHNFVGGTNDGTGPATGLILSDNRLYGTTYGGGSSGLGMVFAISADGTSYTNLHSFGGIDGAYPYPQATLVLLSNRLYGTTSGGGAGSNGTVFAVNTDGTGFTNLYGFTAADNSYGNIIGLVVSGNMLYGTTTQGVSAGFGMVFALKTDGTGFTNLHSFNGRTDGGTPLSRLSLLGNTLYGTAANGGSSGSGTIFALNTDSTNFRILHSFDPLDKMPLSPPYYLVNGGGAYPTCLILSGHKLYGTASTGGGWGIGTVFGLNTDGTDFQVLYTFDNFIWPISPVGPWTTNIDGGTPNCLVLSKNTLYGTAMDYGLLGDGVVFSVSLPLPQLQMINSGVNLLMSWPTDFDGYRLQSNTNLESPSWTTNFPAPVIVNGQYTVTNPVSGTQQFFRLAQ